MMNQGRRWLPGRRLVWVVDGGCAVVSLALACIPPHGTMVSRLRWDAALAHPPEPQPPGTRGRQPANGKRQRSVQVWAERADTPGATVEVDWYRGERPPLWGFSRTALGYTPRLPPGAIREVLGADPAGQLRMEAFVCTDLEATPRAVLPWVVRRGSVEVTCEEASAQLGLETPRPWSALAMARTTPVRLGLGSLVTVLAVPLSHERVLPVEATAWYHQPEPTLLDCVAVVRRHRWRARSLVNSAGKAAFVPCPREALERLLTGLPFAA